MFTVYEAKRKLTLYGMGGVPVGNVLLVVGSQREFNTWMLTVVGFWGIAFGIRT